MQFYQHMNAKQWPFSSWVMSLLQAQMGSPGPEPEPECNRYIVAADSSVSMYFLASSTPSESPPMHIPGGGVLSVWLTPRSSGRVELGAAGIQHCLFSSDLSYVPVYHRFFFFLAVSVGRNNRTTPLILVAA